MLLVRKAVCGLLEGLRARDGEMLVTRVFAAHGTLLPLLRKQEVPRASADTASPHHGADGVRQQEQRCRHGTSCASPGHHCHRGTACATPGHRCAMARPAHRLATAATAARPVQHPATAATMVLPVQRPAIAAATGEGAEGWESRKRIALL